MKTLYKKVIDLFQQTKRRPPQPIYIVGDSHSRAFSYNRNFIPLFLGPGKKINFISDDNMQTVKSKFAMVHKSLAPQKVITYFGEPDTRWLLGKGWYPWEGSVEFVLDDFRQEVNQSVDRYIQLIRFARDHFAWEICVMNVTPTTRVEQNVISEYYNERLHQTCKDEGFMFLPINSRLFTHDLNLDDSYCGDSVHLNSAIQPHVEEILIKKGMIESSGFRVGIEWDHSKVHADFKYNKRFGCYTLKERS